MTCALRLTCTHTHTKFREEVRDDHAVCQIFSEQYRTTSGAVKRAERALEDGSSDGTGIQQLRKRQKMEASEFINAHGSGVVSVCA